MILSNMPTPNEETILDRLISRAFSALGEGALSDDNTNYKPLYYGLLNGINYIIENDDTWDQTIAALKYLQQKAENAYILNESNALIQTGDGDKDYKSLYYRLFSGISLIIEYANPYEIIEALKYLQERMST